MLLFYSLLILLNVHSSNYILHSVYSKVPVSQEILSQPITDSSPIAILLPSNKGQGLCTIAAVCYLADLQNEFLEEYGIIVNKRYWSIYLCLLVKI
jgi:hypothetical protein